MSSYKGITVIPFLAALLLSTPAFAADPPGTPSRVSAKQRVELEKTFLLRSSDEVNRTLAFANETTDLLIRQVEAAAGREAAGKTDERLALLDWYQRYVEWLTGMTGELDREISAFFAKKHFNPRSAIRYEQLTTGSRKLAGELGGKVRDLEGEKKKVEVRMQKVNTAVVERRVPVTRDDLELAHELWPTYKVSHDRREAVYKELSDDEVLYLENELRSLGEKQQYYECFSELGRYELGWLDIKAEDLAKMNEIAKIVDGDDAAALASAYEDAIRTYESHSAALKRMCSELDAKIHALTRSGTLKTLDLLEERSRYYEKMRSRYDREIEWLGSQIGGYQADLTEIGREM